ncbi:MAG TPA: aldose epimerase family protein [Chitinophagaceae bacterium]|jgi:aldose 1-epimerase|nr:aldose epimerase family protein [Chitinophagaceae bacterium]
MAVRTTVEDFGTYQGKPVNKYIITELAGIQVTAINYGAAITGIIVPDNTGTPADVVLGFNSLKGYTQAGDMYMGAICGRFANRIAHAKFRINGSEYHLTNNNGRNCLHGGASGFDKAYWDGELLPEEDGVRFTYRSRDQEEGFPGNLDVSVTYRVENSALHIVYQAVTDKATAVNLTSHCYFNLSGGKEKDILGHELELNADRFLEVNGDAIPTGKLIDVKNTPMDFTTLRRTGVAIGKVNGYDHSWILNRSDVELVKAASLVHKESGRCMNMYTTQPAIHFYSGNLLRSDLGDTKQGKGYDKYAGLCLEAQHFPDSPNHKNFPETILEPGEVYAEKTVYSFTNHN